MSNHGENTVCEEGEIIETSQVKQTVPLPIPPHATPPLPANTLLSISERIEGDGPWQEAIMSTLMRIRNTMFDYTFAKNATDIDRVMVLGCQPMAETLPGEDTADSVILELNRIQPPGTRPPSICHTPITSAATTTAATTIHTDERSSESVASRSDTSQRHGACGYRRRVQRVQGNVGGLVEAPPGVPQRAMSNTSRPSPCTETPHLWALISIAV